MHGADYRGGLSSRIVLSSFIPREVFLVYMEALTFNCLLYKVGFPKPDELNISDTTLLSSNLNAR